MPPAVRTVRAGAMRLRRAGKWKSVGLTAGMLCFMAAPHVAEAQGYIARATTSRTVWVEFGAGGPDRNGYESARAPVEYQLYACRGLTPGSIMVRFRLQPANATASRTYWYEGQRYEPTGRPVVRSALLDATAASPAGEVGSMMREATEGSSLPTDCQSGGNNFSDLGLVSRFADPTRPADVAQFLNTVTLSAAARSEPLRDAGLEQDFARQRAAADRAAADRAAADRAAADRAAAQAQAAQPQPSGGATAGSQTADSTAARQMTPAQRAAADQAAREEEARRAAAQAQEAARRQREQQEEFAASAGEVAGMAARTGGAFGGYYLTGGAAGNSYYKFNDLTGYGVGFNFGPMILDLGQMKGTYSSFFVNDFAAENGGRLPESGEVEGMFVHVGLQLQKSFDSLRMGVSGGYLHGITDDAEVTSPTLGFILGYGMLKARFDLGLGDEGTSGIAMYFQF